MTAREGRDPDDRGVRWAARETARETHVGEVEYAPVARDHEVAVPVRDQTVDRLVQRDAPHRAVERRAECEDAAVTCNQPVPAVVPRGRDADDRPGEMHCTRRPVESRVAETEHTTV